MSLISTSEDGTVFIQSIKEISNGFDLNLNLSLLGGGANALLQEERKKRNQQMLNKSKVHLNMNSLSLVFRQAIEAKNAQIQELKYKVENLKSFF